jgi:hypothetical protein
MAIPQGSFKMGHNAHPYIEITQKQKSIAEPYYITMGTCMPHPKHDKRSAITLNCSADIGSRIEIA